MAVITTENDHLKIDSASLFNNDALMPRTTLSIDSDALTIAKNYATRRGSSLGEAVSELVRRGGRREFEVEQSGPFAVIKLPSNSPTVTAENVKRALEDVL